MQAEELDKAIEELLQLLDESKALWAQRAAVGSFGGWGWVIAYESDSFTSKKVVSWEVNGIQTYDS